MPLTALGIALAVIAAEAGLHARQPPEHMLPIAVLSLCLVAAICTFDAELFRRWRALKAFALASLVPMLAYVFEVTNR